MQVKASLAFLILFVVFTLSWGEEYLLKVEDKNLLKTLKDYGLEIKKKISESIYLIEVKYEDKLKKLSFPNIRVEKNYPLYKQEVVPNDPCLYKKWEYDITKLYSAWEVSTGSQDIYVAVLDTGVDYNHPDLKDNLWINPDENCYNNFDDDGNGYVDDCYGVNILCYPDGTYNPNAPGCNAPDALDDDGHGTHIAGIIGAVANNSLLIAGVNWNIKIIPCKFLDASGNGDIAGEIACLNYIKQLKQEKGLNIVAVNASYGNFYQSNSIQRNEILSLRDLGIVYVTAAGNSGINIDYRNFYPCNYDLENEICVGASDKQDNLASFSNYGFTKVKILAPGEEIFSLSINDHGSNCDSLLPLSGTSMATPFITGAIALIRSIKPNLDINQTIKEILLSGDNKIELSGKVFSCNRLNYSSLLTGDSSQIPKLCLSSLSLDFGTVNLGEFSERNLILRNTGFVDIIPQSVRIVDDNFYIKNDTCSGGLLKPLEECEINIVFSPNTPGYIESTLKISYNYGRNVEIKLSGKGFGEDNATYETISTGGCNINSYGFIILLLLILRLLKIKV